MATFDDLITNAFFEAGIMDQPGQTPPPNFMTDGRQRLKRLISQYSSKQPWLYAIKEDTFPLTALAPGVYHYTIGPTGNFVTTRPLGPLPGGGIVEANIILTDTTPAVSLPLYILSDREWQTEQLKEIPTSIPWAIYNDRGFPNSKLYLRGYPDDGNSLQIYQTQQIGTFTTGAETFSMPPIYEQAITLTLGELLRPGYKVPIPNPDPLAEAARKARVDLTAIQSNPPLQVNDAAGLFRSETRGTWSWRTGSGY